MAAGKFPFEMKGEKTIAFSVQFGLAAESDVILATSVTTNRMRSNLTQHSLVHPAHFCYMLETGSLTCPPRLKLTCFLRSAGWVRRLRNNVARTLSLIDSFRSYPVL